MKRKPYHDVVERTHITQFIIYRLLSQNARIIIDSSHNLYPAERRILATASAIENAESVNHVAAYPKCLSGDTGNAINSLSFTATGYTLSLIHI